VPVVVTADLVAVVQRHLAARESVTAGYSGAAAVASSSPLDRTAVAMSVISRGSMSSESALRRLGAIRSCARPTTSADLADVLLLALDDHTTLAELPHLYPHVGEAHDAALIYLETKSENVADADVLGRSLHRFSVGFCEALEDDKQREARENAAREAKRRAKENKQRELVEVGA
jgi:hypothetical protein